MSKKSSFGGQEPYFQKNNISRNILKVKSVSNCVSLIKSSLFVHKKIMYIAVLQTEKIRNPDNITPTLGIFQIIS